MGIKGPRADISFVDEIQDWNYSDWVTEVTESRDKNMESLKELTAGWDLTAADWGQVPEATIEYTPEEVAMYKAVNWAQIHGVASLEKDPFKGRRFIGVSEPVESDVIDNEFLMRFTGP
ncbi:hypothetical protein SEA_ATUIN_300 [Arthrobacter phage Atuin]|nr:hypothetical protein SEA_ATUIN_99 [Arthrobacter phage Atuin]